MKDKIEIYERAVEYLQHMYSADLDEEYSGRGMYGKTTPAIVTDAPPPMVGWAVTCAAIEIAEYDDPQDAAGDVPQRWDSMGLSMVYY